MKIQTLKSTSKIKEKGECTLPSLTTEHLYMESLSTLPPSSREEKKNKHRAITDMKFGWVSWFGFNYY